MRIRIANRMKSMMTKNQLNEVSTTGEETMLRYTSSRSLLLSSRILQKLFTFLLVLILVPLQQQKQQLFVSGFGIGGRFDEFHGSQQHLSQSRAACESLAPKTQRLEYNTIRNRRRVVIRSNMDVNGDIRSREEGTGGDGESKKSPSFESFSTTTSTTVISDGDELGADRKSNFDENKSSERDIIRDNLIEELSALAYRTQRGFNATRNEQTEARRIIFELAQYNPTSEPAISYYPNARTTTSPTLTGKWTLVYTDAPDIISLDSSSNNNAELGRIGQECEPPYIRNVIEWTKPSWVDFLPFSGTDNSRIFQKVVTKAQASPESPTIVRLQLAGVQLVTDSADEEKSSSTDSKNGVLRLFERVQKRGILPTLLQQIPIRLEGPLQAPFGEFEILYLDSQIRIVRTGQNYLAVNRRIQSDAESWF